MGYANQENQQYAVAKSIATDANLAAIETRPVETGYFGIVWTGAGGSSAVVKLQDSGDGTNWDDLSGKTKTISAPSGHGNIKLNQDELLAPWIRAVITANGETTGTVNISYFLKGHKG